MGLFKKSSTTHFVRDSRGRVVRVEKSDEEEPKFSKEKLREFKFREQEKKLKEKLKRENELERIASLKKQVKAKKTKRYNRIIDSVLGSPKSATPKTTTSSKPKRKPTKKRKSAPHRKEYVLIGSRAYPKGNVGTKKKQTRRKSTKKSTMKHKPKRRQTRSRDDDWLNPSGLDW